jgi:CRP-like cAMP-binding protein
VELADRFRHMHLFSFVSVDELFRIAALGRQVRYDSSRVVYEQGRMATSLSVLLDGRVTIEGTTPRTLDAPAVLAFDSVLEGTPIDATVRAAGTAICLSLNSDELLSLMSENVEIAEGIFRLLVETGRSLEVVHAPPTSVPESRAGELQAVDLVRMLQATPLFSRATTGQLLALATIARRTVLKSGVDPLAGLPTAMLVVVSGSARVIQDGQAPNVAAVGDVIGIPTALGGRVASIRVEALSDGEAIYFFRTELFELLADHIDLLQAVYSALLRLPGRSTELVAV